VSDFDALLIAFAAAGGVTAFLAARGHLTITLRRRPEPRRPAPTGDTQ
jgi:hypothetical protein